MDQVYHLLQQRNSYETDPFIAIHESNSKLQNLVDHFQSRCDELEREFVERDLVSEGGVGGGRKNSTSISRNEAELMDKIESLQHEINERHRANSELQSENDELKKKNDQLVGRLVSEKESMMEQINNMNEENESLKLEVDLLRAMKEQAEQEKKSKGYNINVQNNKDPLSPMESDPSIGRKWGSFGVVLPTAPKHTIKAHSIEALGVRYDGTGGDIVATAGNDSSIKLWDTRNGQLKSTLRGSSGHPMLGVDMLGGLVAGCSSDKTCRVWNVKTGRMVHHLVGHMHKITCMRICADSKNIITASADRSIRAWDITRSTYRQSTSLRHSSTTNAIDISTDCNTIVSGHMDGSLRFWDLRSGDRTADIPGWHTGGVTSVEFDPTNKTYLLSNGRDSCLKITDVRMCSAVNTMKHRDFKTLYNWSSCCYSPDGMYAAAGSSSPGTMFIWRTSDGKLEKKLEDTHSAGVVGIAWGRGGTNGQQVATVDKQGSLVLWA